MSSAAPLPSYEELVALVVELRSELTTARAELAAALARIAISEVSEGPFHPRGMPGGAWAVVAGLAVWGPGGRGLTGGAVLLGALLAW
jgi:hypothetical protein